MTQAGEADPSVMLMQRIAAGDVRAFRALYDRHAGVVFAIAVRLLRDHGDAEQLLIDVFAEAWERAGRYDAARGTPVTYLATLARSRAIDRLRSQRSAGKVVDADSGPAQADPGPSPVDQSIATEHGAMVCDALRRLEPVQRRAVELSFYSGLSHSEIAKEMNRPLGTVKTLVRQGLIQMRDTLRARWEGKRGGP